MCGICGKIYFDRNQKVERNVIEQMTQLLRHRGPDDQGLHLKDNAGLGHRRLSIIDLARGHQPIYNEDKSLCIVFNGEIYNYRDLREELLQSGHQFATNSDTEVILHLYEDLREKCLDKLRGMFAFAIWDEKHQQLFMAVDRIGKKPLYYARLGDCLLFASEMKSLLVEPKIKRTLNLKSLNSYLTYQYVPAPDTIFESIQKLPPASYLIYNQGRIAVSRYWHLVYEPKVDITEEEACQKTIEVMDEAVRIRLESEVLLGCFLSGGVDSSTIVAFMRRHISSALRTFSIGFEEDSFNELPYARQIAEKFETEHTEFTVTTDAIKVLPLLVWHFDEPYADSSALPTFYVAQLTRQHVTVALNGDGGDESFCGYSRYQGFPAFNRYRRVPYLIRRYVLQKPLKAFYHLLPNSTLLEKAHYLNEVSLLDPYRLYAQTMLIFRDYMKMRMYSSDLKFLAYEHNALQHMLKYMDSNHARALIDKMTYSDIMTYLPGDLLPKMDRMTMAHGLEGRSPLLDQKVMEFAARLPVGIRFREGVLKYLLKRALTDVLPYDILWRQKKGFGVPISSWFKKDLYELAYEFILSTKARQRGFFNMKYIEKILKDHKTGRQNHHHRIWSLLCLEVWCRTFLDRADISSGPISL